MRDRRSADALRRIVTIRDAQRTSSRQSLFEAAARERDATAVRRRAEDEVRSADADWQGNMQKQSFDPDLSRALAGRLMDCVQARVSAQVAETRASDEQAACEAEWHAGNALCRQAEKSLQLHRRQIARDRDERLLERDADRVTFKWSRR